jgi:hypothetical protein
VSTYVPSLTASIQGCCAEYSSKEIKNPHSRLMLACRTLVNLDHTGRIFGYPLSFAPSQPYLQPWSSFIGPGSPRPAKLRMTQRSIEPIEITLSGCQSVSLKQIRHQEAKFIPLSLPVLTALAEHTVLYYCYDAFRTKPFFEYKPGQLVLASAETNSSTFSLRCKNVRATSTA